jgi:hypothetical protein
MTPGAPGAVSPMALVTFKPVTAIDEWDNCHNCHECHNAFKRKNGPLQALFVEFLRCAVPRYIHGQSWLYIT